MAADYWTSTQRMNWQFTRDSLSETRKKLSLLEDKLIDKGEVSNYPIKYDIYMKIYLHCLLIKLGRRLNIRQIALATSEVYLSRFLTRVSIREINVYLLVTTCIYLSCKIEECPQHIRTIVGEARNLWPEYIPHDATNIAEFEFYIIEELESFLILHHPYRSLLQINDVLLQNNNFALQLTPEELQNSWSIINDSYISDLHLIFPPHIIAVSALYITIVLGIGQHFLINLSMNLHDPNDNEGKDYQHERIENFVRFLGLSNIDLSEVADSIQEILTIYSLWESYDESSVKKNLQMIILNR